MCTLAGGRAHRISSTRSLVHTEDLGRRAVSDKELRIVCRPGSDCPLRIFKDCFHPHGSAHACDVKSCPLRSKDLVLTVRSKLKRNQEASGE